LETTLQFDDGNTLTFESALRLLRLDKQQTHFQTSLQLQLGNILIFEAGYLRVG
jgi:hypothetical protein